MFEISDKEFWQLADFIQRNYGIQLKDEKRSLLAGRLQGILAKKNIRSFTDYYQYLISDKTGEAMITFIDKITTNHTFFMREVEHFYYFRDVVLPYLRGTVRDRDLRIWCAASSTGEESYTLAMLVDEFFGTDRLFWDTKILATDISGQVLDQARAGVYGNDRIASLPASWRNQYFRKINKEQSIVTDRIRNEVIYRKFNLMEPVFPFKKKFHVIFARNVMIYFDTPTKNELVEKFYEALDYGGYLFIGHSESLNREATRFKYVMPAVYKKQ